MVAHAGVNRVILQMHWGCQTTTFSRIDPAYAVLNVIDYFTQYSLVRFMNGVAGSGNLRSLAYQEFGRAMALPPMAAQFRIQMLLFRIANAKICNEFPGGRDRKYFAHCGGI